jgi:hypothetical protein
MQFGPHEDPESIKSQLLELVRKAPVDEVMVFFFAEEQNDGHETPERIKLWLDRSRPWREALKKEGIFISTNPWHTLLHADRGRTLKPSQKWQTMVGPKGDSCKATVCPLDKSWRQYYENNLRMFAKEGFRVVWIDDDIRFHNHAPLDWGGCFCPLHIGEFNRRYGLKATREEIVRNCTATGEPHPWRDKWLDMWEVTHLEMISRWRDILAETGTRPGLMSSLPEVHSAEGRRWKDWWKAFGGNKPPIHRPHYCSYGETLGRDITSFIITLDQGRTIQPAEIESGPEMDNGPYGPWNKPFSETGAQLALAHVLGSTNINISLHDFLGNRPDDEPERIDFLKEWHPVCDWLADGFPMTMKSHGIGIPWSEDMGRKVHTDGSGKWQSLICKSRGWANWLGAAGIAFSARPSWHVNALNGNAVWAFSDKQLKEWLSQSLLIDGEAAQILVERGFGKHIGIRNGRRISFYDILYSIEHCTDADFALRLNAQMPMNHEYSEHVYQAELAPGARAVSELRSPTQKVVGHGLTVFENSLGGRVAVVPWNANSHVIMTTQRAGQLRKVLAWLDRKNNYGWVDSKGWLVPQFLTDGRKWRGVIWNGGADDVKRFDIHLPHGMKKPKHIVQVDAHGKRSESRLTGNTVKLKHPLHEWEFVVLL